MLVDVHGQHDHQYLLKPSNQLDVLDHFADLWTTRAKYHEMYEKADQMPAATGGAATPAARCASSSWICTAFRPTRSTPPSWIRPSMEELQARRSVLANLEKLKKEAGAVARRAL